MVDTKVLSPSEIAEEHGQEAHAPYLLVWLWLAILTGVEYFYAAGLKDFFVILLGGLLVLAGIKAALVGWYFMHLKFEGKWVYLLIVPAIVLATIFVLALVPDQSLKPEDIELEETGQIAPAAKGHRWGPSYPASPLLVRPDGSSDSVG
jgi:cytochrome c oxidase subunit IV